VRGPGGVRPAGEHSQELDRHADQRAACRRAQFDASEALCHVGEVLGRGPPVVARASNLEALCGAHLLGLGRLKLLGQDSNDPCA
jgi:hypothetical protein